MSWPPVPAHFDYDDEFLDDVPPDDSDDVVYVSKVTGLPIGQETRHNTLPATQRDTSGGQSQPKEPNTHTATQGHERKP